MKIKRYIVVCLSLIISLNTLANQQESTDNYAFGAELTLTDPESMFSRVELDKRVYTQAVSPTLDDVRVFNRSGHSVPFSLIEVYDKQRNQQQFNMQLYPITQDNLVKTNANNRNYSVAVDDQNVSISIDKSDDAQGKYINSYLLQIPNDSKINAPISNLKLSFAGQAENWQATANLSYSTDLRYWRTVVNDVPIMELMNSDHQQLTLTDINFQPNTDYQSHNWLITIVSQKPIPALTQAIASSNNLPVSNTLYPIEVALTSSDNQTAIYALPTAVPIKELSVELYHAGSVLPVSIYYKENINDKNWIKLDDRIIRKSENYDEPERITLNGRLIAALKFISINSTFEEPPKLVAYRNKVDLVFNSANNAPFILAWGSAQPKAAALPSSALLSSGDSLQSLALAFMGDDIKLAGNKALTTDNESKSVIFADWVIWLGLIIAAGILILLACKLFKEIKQQN